MADSIKTNTDKNYPTKERGDPSGHRLSDTTTHIMGPNSAVLYDFRSGKIIEPNRAGLYSPQTPPLIHPRQNPPLAAEYFRQDRGPLVSFDNGVSQGATGKEPLNKDGACAIARFQGGHTYKFYIDSWREAKRAYRVIFDYLVVYHYITYVEHFDLSYESFVRNLNQLKKTFNRMTRLPAKAKVLWPGSKKADLVPFLQTHYGKYLGNGLTMAWIWQHDRPLYHAIHYAKKVHKFPEDIVIPSERDAMKDAVRKFIAAGEADLAGASLTPKERRAVARKVRRSVSVDM
jgi:hypothetical protein